jgi:hypothetical protein
MLSCCGASGIGRLSPQHCAAFFRCGHLPDDAETEDADKDQVQRNDVVQQSRHDENQNAGDEGNDGLDLGDADGHKLSPLVAAKVSA